MSKATRVTELINSEKEKISIQRCMTSPFIGQHILVIHDDDGKATAPHLLDLPTVNWLLAILPEIKTEIEI